MGGFRAKDDDRDRYVEVIETAYVDGQLGAEDRDLRISRVLTAETLDELDVLTRDLQNQPARTVVQAPAPRVIAPEPIAAPEPVQWPVPPRNGLPAKAIGFVAAGIIGLTLIAMASAAREQPPTLFGEPDSSMIEWEEDPYVAPEPAFQMNPRHLREMVSSYEAEFGTRQALEVVFRPRRVVVVVPAADGQGPARWSWDGSWTEVEATAADGSRPSVDLGAVDPRRLVDNIGTATDALRVEDGRFSRAVLSRQGKLTVLEIFIGNKFNELGSLVTTPGGDIVRREPFER